jgi:hypothetical protein
MISIMCSNYSCFMKTHVIVRICYKQNVANITVKVSF